MAIYTTYFVGTDAQLAAALPGFRPRLLSPVRARRRDPFTQREVEYPSFDPRYAPGAPVEVHAAVTLDARPRPSLIESEGDYARYLEERLPPGVRSLPHLAWKSMDAAPLAALARALEVFPDDETFFDALVDLRFCDGAALNEVPSALVRALASLDDRRAVAERWVEDEDVEGSSPDDVLPFLEGLCELARMCGDGARLALLTEW